MKLLQATSYKPQADRRGFSLLELLIYMAVLSIVILFVSGTFTSINQGRGRSTARTEVNGAMRFAFDQIRQDITASTGVSTPRYGRIMTCSATTNCLVATVGGSTITYDVTSNQIRRNTIPITPTSVNITSFTVEYFGNNNAPSFTIVPAFQVSITAAYNSSSADYQYSETKQSTFAQVLSYSTAARGSITGASVGSCIVILGIPICV